MSNNDSFIDEVTEEVRRDKLFAAFRKYGWIGAVVVIGIVGGTAWNEWQQSREAARAQAFGDAVLDALDLGAPDERGEHEQYGQQARREEHGPHRHGRIAEVGTDGGEEPHLELGAPAREWILCNEGYILLAERGFVSPM